jgi:hypothetical protein
MSNEALDIATPIERLLELLDHEDWHVRLSVLRHPKISDSVASSKRFDKDWRVRSEAVMRVNDPFFLLDHVTDTHYMVKLSIIANRDVDEQCLNLLVNDDDAKVAFLAREKLWRIQKK